MIDRIVFWDPCVSPHKSYFLEALAGLGKYEIILCAHEDIPKSRKDLGWSTEDPVGYVQYILPSPAVVAKLCYERSSTTLHILSGIRWVPTINRAIEYLRKNGGLFAIMMEPRVQEGFSGFLRLWQSRLSESWLRKNASFVLAIGANGPNWFLNAWYPEERIYPFAYFIQPKNSDCKQRQTEKIKVAYVGRLVDAKGISDLILAFDHLDDRFSLEIVGDGAQRDKLAYAARSNPNISFLGLLPINDVVKFLSQVDFLVLPSRSMDDGWGVVISEALFAGCVAVATNCVGASLVLNDKKLGSVVPPRDPVSIANAILCHVNEENIGLASRAYRTNWAADHLSADAGVKYLDGILEKQFNRGGRFAPFYE